MEKIKDTTKLPDWFNKRIYKKNLSDIDWYREIRMRQNILSLVNLRLEYPIDADSDIQSFLNQMLENDDVRPDSLIYDVSQDGTPIRNLSVGEVAFLAYSTQKSDVSGVAQQYQKILVQWSESIDEMLASGRDGPSPLFGEYEVDLPKFLDQFEENDPKFDCPITKYSDPLMNPWLSYGRPLNGYPVTIDTQFDDETILQNVKTWLVETRKKEGSKARRPFNQNDFDDWELYKIREIFDLQTWGIINEKKILDRVLADKLWPNSIDEFSPIDVLRTTARKKAKDIFDFETVTRFYGQLKITHGENFLLK